MRTLKESAYKTFSALTARFAEHLDEYKTGPYNETRTRIDYIDPFFRALGWDMDNTQGLAEAYREVIHEDKIRVGRSTKAPDYCFTVYGQRKFFVDAKRPSVDVKCDISPAYQVRRYGWSARLALAVVTDFEEFAVYDCTTRPRSTDKASVSRIAYITYDQYLEQFDFLWDLFAKESVLKGRFDKFVQSDTKKKGTATVDEEFLKSIEEWRTYLATTIALRNINLDEDEINYAVQKTIDRIIFLRICEDRGVEPSNGLKHVVEHGDVYQNLYSLFRTADEKYNSGLFDLREDRITPGLVIDNKVLKIIIKELYYPQSEFEFSVMPADILGSVYERFLGKTIRLTAAHHAKIEEKPEVRKAGGVYYTPKYIVDYIVQNTVGKLVEGKTPKQVAALRICDPACGSGSFLLGAYQYLLDWHLGYYLGPSPSPPLSPALPPAGGREKGTAYSSVMPVGKRDRVTPGRRGGILTPDGKLTTGEKKRILLNNIYGVDIDSQAVEVTRLNLLLKAMEGETTASINQQLSIFHERVLPNLDHNIRCGNSLIGPDFYDNQAGLFPEQLKKINAFDWHSAFPEVFKQGGFDAVIGNPPYIQLSMFDWFENAQKSYLLGNYCSSMGRLNTYGFFIEKGIKLLNKNSKLAYIIPNTLLTQEYYQSLRKYILNNAFIDEIVSYEKMPFTEAIVETITLFLTSQDTGLPIKITNCQNRGNYSTQLINRNVYQESYQNQFITKINTKNLELKNRIDHDKLKIGAIAEVNQAIALKKDRAAYIFSDKSGDDFKPLLDGRDINRYSLNWPGNYLKYDIKSIHSCKREDIFLTSEKIIFRRVSANLIATLDTHQFYALNTLVVINLRPEIEFDIRYLLALFNSKLINWYYNTFFKSTKKVFSEIQARSVKQIPIPDIDLNKKEDVVIYNQIVSLVNNLLILNQELQVIKLNIQRQQIQQAMDHSEKRIDQLVYELYGLGEEEIKIIENL